MPIQKHELDDATFSSFSKSFRGDPHRSFYVKGNNKKTNKDLLKFEKKTTPKQPKQQTTDFGSKKSQHFHNLLKTLLQPFSWITRNRCLLCCRVICSVLFTSTLYALPHIYVSFHKTSCNSPIFISKSPTIYSFYIL